MKRLWCVFFALARKKSADSILFFLLTVLFALATSALCRADACPYQWANPGSGPIRIGDHLVLSVIPSTAASPSPLPSSSVPTAENSDLTATFQDAGWVILSQNKDTLEISALKTGELSIPLCANIKINIESAIAANDPKPQEPAPFLPPVDLPFPLWAILLFSLLGITLLTTIIYSLYRYSKSRKKQKSTEPAVVILPEDEEALEALNRLASAQYPEKNQFKKHFFGISDIVKHYLGRRYGFNAPEMTGTEILAHLQSQFEREPELINTLPTLFKDLDWVKYTDHLPSIQESYAIINTARTLITSTRKRVIVTERSTP